MMRTKGAGVIVLALAATAAPEPKPTPVDIKPFRDKLMVFSDANGGIYVVLRESGGDTRIRYGTPKAVYEQLVTGGAGNGDAWSINTWAPRIAEMRPGSFDRKADGTFQRSCDGK